MATSDFDKTQGDALTECREKLDAMSDSLLYVQDTLGVVLHVAAEGIGADDNRRIEAVVVLVRREIDRLMEAAEAAAMLLRPAA